MRRVGRGRRPRLETRGKTPSLGRFGRHGRRAQPVCIRAAGILPIAHDNHKKVRICVHRQFMVSIGQSLAD
jgi:hypothetical protein